LNPGRTMSWKGSSNKISTFTISPICFKPTMWKWWPIF
jgi:hypothetical protein